MTSLPSRYDFSLWYCLEDNPIATSISETLREHGFHGYVEHQDHVAGRSVLTSASEVIQSSRVAILLLSPRSLADPWCQRVAEWILAHSIHQEGAKVIPVYVDVRPEQTPPALRLLTGLEYNERFFKRRLLSSLQKSRPRTRALGPAGVAKTKSRVGF